MDKLTIQEIANILVEKNGLEPEAANRFATEFFAIVLQRLQQGEQVKIKGLGTFKITSVEARESISVRTGERVVIDSHSKVTFIPDTTMKELVNKPFSQFETVVLNEGVEFEDMKVEVTETENVAEEETVVTEEQPAKPVVEEQPAEPVVAPMVSEQPTEVAEPAVEKQPAEPVVEDEPLDIDEEPVDEEENPVDDEDEPVDEKEIPAYLHLSEEEEQKILFSERDDHDKPWWFWIASAFGVGFLMLVSAWGGYQYGVSMAVVVPDTVVVNDTVYMAEEDTTNLIAEEPLTNETAPQPVVQEEAKPVVQEEAKPAEVLDKWSAKDERVRLGAYRIVGTAEEVTVLAGQTFYSICRAHLGNDMQCYVEVYNNLPSNPQIKEGQIIKIPKLERKKRGK